MPLFLSLSGFRIYLPSFSFRQSRLLLSVVAAFVIFILLAVTLHPSTETDNHPVWTTPPQLKLPTAQDSLAAGFDPLSNPVIAKEVAAFRLQYEQKAAGIELDDSLISPVERQQRALRKLADKVRADRKKAVQEKAAKEAAQAADISISDDLPETPTNMSFSAAGLTLKSKVKLSSGFEMPVLGFGVYQSYGEEVINSVYHALKTGYRHIDSATLYENEREVGVAVKKWIHDTGGKREDVFYTTKIWDTDQGYKNAKKAINWSLRQCDLGYIDLYLIHSPYPGRQLRKETWQAMEEAVQEGKIKSIGVSNYGIKHLKEMEEYATIKPAVNQLEVHPFLTRKELVEFCQSHNIVVEAFCPITRGLKFKDSRVQALVQKYKRTPAQIMLRWSLERGLVPLPKSSNPKRIEENSQVFDFSLEPADVESLMTKEYFIVDWDPTNVA
ncbi:NADP-dependent oxidoreductase domain-containing protein [Myxozyma melibiosi]|uniref:NADP-dependent oxidoreductase domain-containing protein n=1 Tax=Myxozyma melibiosi TaxID=54550 RepID=A0ABR1F773_9ASCO